MMIAVEQRTAEWADLRVGKVTGSRVSDVVAEIKGRGEAAPRRNYRAELVAEILTGIPAPEPFITREMRWGVETEPLAIAAYECRYGVLVEPMGFATHPTIARFGVSPDGLVGTDGILQVKCLNTANHLAMCLAGTVPAEYEPQMVAELACTGRRWCDFVSFDPRVDGATQLFVRRFVRDQARIAELEVKVELFLQEVDGVVKHLRSPAQRLA
jgi:YqaJ-like viral recombinase domain